MGTHAGELTLFHERFIAEYFLDLKATAAYVRAGGAAKRPDTAVWAMMQRPQVKAEIARRRAIEVANHKQVLEISHVTRDWVIQRQKVIVERCLQEVPVVDAKGEEKGVWRFDAAGALGGLALMRKDLGMDKVEPLERTPQDIGQQVNIYAIIGDPEARRALETVVRRLEGQPGSNSGPVVEGTVAQG